MKQIIKPISTMVAMVAMLSFGSCSNEVEVMSFSPEKSNQQGVDFVAEFTPQQEAALIETGNPYGEVAQKDSWTSIARSDVYRELDDVVYDGNNNVLTEAQRLELQAALNNGNPTPPSGGRIPNVH